LRFNFQETLKLFFDIQRELKVSFLMLQSGIKRA